MKKLDAWYFQNKTNEIIAILEGESAKNIPDDILKQIALDAAEAQKVADIEAAEKWEIKNGGYGLIRNMDSIIAAIRSATVKWEVPGE